MSSLSTFTNPITYHILSYGVLLGSTLYQSFLAGIIAFRVLPRPQFSTLQQHTFPVYFLLQTIVPALLLLTHPSGPAKLLSYINPLGAPSSPSYLNATSPTEKLSAVLIAIMFISGLVNWWVVGPATTKTMRERKHQETRDGKKSYDAPPHSKEMQALNKKFGMLHGVSSLVNLVAVVAEVWYAGVLGEGLRF
ncbi:hypothetical protein GQ43DRAFT_440246 [Delitschia confertaspora ATCC 74209]|uniref:TMEM205-like domain-containing protein n=1 Tax=Delitschia confertaspora ATCC 74209 TaxID=1513339 RepID=A0A9P4JP76_9PLEO|nr:hypothetical protein GQ43DRAFT_440246 [Delitschia confertaspora ATCC 74209]